MGTQVRCHATPSTDPELGFFSYVLCEYAGSGVLSVLSYQVDWSVGWLILPPPSFLGSRFGDRDL